MRLQIIREAYDTTFLLTGCCRPHRALEKHHIPLTKVNNSPSYRNRYIMSDIRAHNTATAICPAWFCVLSPLDSTLSPSDPQTQSQKATCVQHSKTAIKYNKGFVVLSMLSKKKNWQQITYKSIPEAAFPCRSPSHLCPEHGVNSSTCGSNYSSPSEGQTLISGKYWNLYRAGLVKSGGLSPTRCVQIFFSYFNRGIEGMEVNDLNREIRDNCWCMWTQGWNYSVWLDSWTTPKLFILVV